MEPQDLITFAINAFKAGDYTLVVASSIMLVIWILTKTPLKDKIPSSSQKWAALVIAIGSALATNLFAGGSWASALGTGVATGLAAIGLWETGGKPLAKKAASKEAAVTQKDLWWLWVDDESHEWTKATITGQELRDAFKIPRNIDIFWVKPGEPDMWVDLDSVVELNANFPRTKFATQAYFPVKP